VDFILRNNIDCLYKTIVCHLSQMEMTVSSIFSFDLQANMRSRFEHEKSIHSADLKSVQTDDFKSVLFMYF
jgi:hypothetical protein